ncbi:nitroreductase family protein [Amycolatopsis anabasis]|uniref:nitroreductase family protein n=1 Tax=Amycolatopsis anabasis TaxID=1840409 RepID=UPI00131E1882|nr:nitroreductase family protein [Amycolatopsis anabasis]
MTTDLVSLDRHVWSCAEKAVLARAATRAPHCGLGCPWTLEVREDRVELYEQFDGSAWHNNTGSRERVIACGAALANLTSAIRVLGWEAGESLFIDPLRPDLVARITARTRRRTTRTDVVRYSAIFRQRRHRHAVDPGLLPAGVLHDILAAGCGPGIRAHPLHGNPPVGRRTVGEPCFLVVTETSGRRELLLAGSAMQQMSLVATENGLSCSVLTRPLQSPELRNRLLRHLGLTGVPQLMLCVGYPLTTSLPTPRRVIGESEELR